MQKTTVMETAVQKEPSSEDIISALYDPREVNDRAIIWEKIGI